MFRALADPTRRAILDELTERDGQTLLELCARLATKHGLGSTRQSISQHLAVLEGTGLVTTWRDGRGKLHTLDTAPLRQIADLWSNPRSRRSRSVSTPGSRSCHPRTPTAPSSPWNPTSTRRPGLSSVRSWKTASRSSRSRSPTAEHKRLVGRGVRFTQPPSDLGTITTAVFDDTCGNLVQITAEAT